MPSPPPPRIFDNLKQTHFNRVSWGNKSAANLRFPTPTRSRFASEDRAGEATFYPAGSPIPMQRASDEQRRYYSTDRYVEEPESYSYEPQYVEPPPVPVPPPAKKKKGLKGIFSRNKTKTAPVKKESRIKGIFSRRKNKKVKAGAGTVVVETDRPLPPTPHTQSTPPLVIQPPAVPASDISTSRRYELHDPGFIPRRMSVTESRAESLRKESVRNGSQPPPSVFGPAVTPRAEGSVVSHHERHWDQHSGSVFDAGPAPMLVDRQSGNRVPRDLSYVSTGSHHSAVPAKKKRSFGGTLKRLFTRKKKLPPPEEHVVSVYEPEPVVGYEPHYVEEEHYPHEVQVEHPPAINHIPVPMPAPAPESATVAIPRPAPSSAPSPRPAVVVRPGSARTHSVRTHSTRSRSSAGPPVISPHSSRTHSSARSPLPDVVIPVSPRDSIPLRQGTASSVVPPRRYNTGSSIAVPRRYNGTPVVSRQPTTSSAGLGRQGTTSTTGLGRKGTTSTTGLGRHGSLSRHGSLGRHGTSSTTGRRAATAPVPAPVLSQVTGSESPSVHSAAGADRSWGEIHVPPEPVSISIPTSAPAPAPAPALGGSRLAGFRLGLELGRGLAPPPTVPAPRARPARRIYTAPPPRAPYVHVPRPIPPPPRYPSLPTRVAPTTNGMEAQVQLIVTALRDLAAEERHQTAVAQQRLEEERAWNEEERQRDAELRALIVQLVSRSGTTRRGTPEGLAAAAATLGTSEFGVGVGEGITATTAARGLGVAGTGEEAALLSLLLAYARL